LKNQEGTQHLRIAIVCVALDLKLFDILTESSESLTVEKLAQKTGAAPVLLSNAVANSIGIHCQDELGD